jgi:hypothetical protein
MRRPVSDGMLYAPKLTTHPQSMQQYGQTTAKAMKEVFGGMAQQLRVDSDPNCRVTTAEFR